VAIHTCRSALQRLEIRQSTSHTGSHLADAAAGSFFAWTKTEIGPDVCQGPTPKFGAAAAG
jgi:hypothetical protein